MLADADDVAVRRRWALLEEAGVPSAARHTGPTHRPHVTLASGPPPPAPVLRTAAEVFAPLLPLDLPVHGLGLLGRPGRAVLVELLAPPLPARAARDGLVDLWTGADDRPWLPHVTLAQRLAPAVVAAALTALGEQPGSGASVRRAVGLRWWDPDRGVVTPVVG